MAAKSHSHAVLSTRAVLQEAAGEGIPILLLGNKMDMDGHREVSFKEAEQLAYVSLTQSLWIILFYVQ